jgi:hypothetical protein
MISKERLKSIAVGDFVCVDGKECPVTFIGRKYFKVQLGYRDVQFIIDEGRHYDPSGFGNKHKLWDTIGDYQREKEAVKAWDSLRSWFNGKYQKPSHLSTETINEVLELLESKEGGENV